VNNWRNAFARVASLGEMNLDVAHAVALIGPLYLLAVAVPLSIIDVRERRLPNRLTLPGIPIALVSQLAASWMLGKWIPLAIAVIWMLGGFAVGLAFNRLQALGMGDAKLIAVICLNLGWFGWFWPVAALTMAFGIATAFALFMHATGRYKISSTIPLGPYLLVGFLASTIGLVAS
jgi:leader peptidase (prepilin peptidase)/N-methyltransferase